MPTPECWEELGTLSAKIDVLMKQHEENEDRIRKLEHDRVRITTIGGVVALALTGLGVLFSDAIRAFGNHILH